MRDEKLKPRIIYDSSLISNTVSSKMTTTMKIIVEQTLVCPTKAIYRGVEHSIARRQRQ